MDIKLNPDEEKLVEYAKKKIVEYNIMRHKKRGIDTLYSFVLSDSGKIHDGACFESDIAQATICGERQAIANMIMGEGYGTRIKSIVVADPVPEIQEKSTPPCGTCRQIIWQFGTIDTSVICMQYIQEKDNSWIFPKFDRYLIKELFPHPYEPKEGLWI